MRFSQKIRWILTVAMVLISVNLVRGQNYKYNKGELLYQNPLDSEKTVKDWIMEGSGVLEFKDGWMHIFDPSLPRRDGTFRYYIKDEAHIMMYVDERKIIDWTDDGQIYGPVYGKGKIGFRQMQWSHFRYRNFKVWAIGR